MSEANHKSVDDQGTEPEDVVSLRIRQYTRQRLSGYGEEGETHDEVINRLMDAADRWRDIRTLVPQGDGR